MRFSVCIPTIRTKTLEHAVRSVLAQTFQDWELIVVGQGGEEAGLREATERAARGDDRVTYIHLDRLGASAGRNGGAVKASGEIIAYMDDDCEAAPDWLEEVDRHFGDDIGLVTGSLLAPPKVGRRLSMCPTFVPLDVVYDPAISGQTQPHGFGLLGANMAVRRTEFEKVGGFDECMGTGSKLQGGEEHDYVYRLALAGTRMRSTPAAVMIHTYGIRYGVRAIYSHRSERIRGDGAVAAKGTMLELPDGGGAIRNQVLRLARVQLSTLSVRRLPHGLFRLFHLLTSYRECLRGYAVVLPVGAGPCSALLAPRPAGKHTSVAPVLRTNA